MGRTRIDAIRKLQVDVAADLRPMRCTLRLSIGMRRQKCCDEPRYAEMIRIRLPSDGHPSFDRPIPYADVVYCNEALNVPPAHAARDGAMFRTAGNIPGRPVVYR